MGERDWITCFATQRRAEQQSIKLVAGLFFFLYLSIHKYFTADANESGVSESYENYSYYSSGLNPNILQLFPMNPECLKAMRTTTTLQV